MFGIGDKISLHGLTVISVDRGTVTLETPSGARFQVPFGDVPPRPSRAPFISALLGGRRPRRG
jgi:hypothetical protein